MRITSEKIRPGLDREELLSVLPVAVSGNDVTPERTRGSLLPNDPSQTSSSMALAPRYSANVKECKSNLSHCF